MTKLKLNINEGVETPSQTIVKQSLKEISVVDSLGRTIVVKRPSWFRQTEFLRALGKKSVDEEGKRNDVYIDAISSVMFAKSIDGVLVTLNNELEISKWINELDIEGKMAIEKCLVENFIFPTAEAARDDIKN
jgi:hypothetical protein